MVARERDPANHQWFFLSHYAAQFHWNPVKIAHFQCFSPNHTPSKIDNSSIKRLFFSHVQMIIEICNFHLDCSVLNISLHLIFSSFWSLVALLCKQGKTSMIVAQTFHMHRATSNCRSLKTKILKKKPE